MKLVTYQNTRAPAGMSVLVAVILVGHVKPLPGVFMGDSRDEVEGRARAAGARAEAFERKHAEKVRAAAAKRLAAKAAKAAKG